MREEQDDPSRTATLSAPSKEKTNDDEERSQKIEEGSFRLGMPHAASVQFSLLSVPDILSGLDG